MKKSSIIGKSIIHFIFAHLEENGIDWLSYDLYMNCIINVDQNMYHFSISHIADVIDMQRFRKEKEPNGPRWHWIKMEPNTIIDLNDPSFLDMVVEKMRRPG